MRAGYWDPIGLSKAEFWDNTNEETIGWLRHSEIKHGRVAMAGFVGYCLQANGVKFPWAPFDAITATSPPEQWDALPDAAKWQIILGVGFLEWWSEIRCAAHPESLGVLSERQAASPPTRSTCSNLRRLTPVSARHVSFDGTPHYMKGGKPGYVPAFDAVPEKLPHWVGLNLWDPFKFTANVPAEKKQAQLVTEINNGRLAMCAATALAPAPPKLTLGRCHSHASCVPPRTWLRAVACGRATILCHAHRRAACTGWASWASCRRASWRAPCRCSRASSRTTPAR